ncbi:MAG TPA: oxygen-independent coproporphyrinogen III oxidase [Vicinamibacterales bacterium]|nr:oxygen-independent coproporphyrinogen III oxidase [Vicinamibacterales bacterium]
MTPRDLFAKYDVQVPRYTSYPPVPQWTDTPSGDAWIGALGAALEPSDASLALYVHLPFCESLCTFCGCNNVITRDHGREGPYVARVLAELQMYLAAVPALAARPLRQVHFGGGTPTFLAPETLAHLADAIARGLPARAGAFEAGFEADPRVTTTAHLETLAGRGFRRISMGVQDIDEEVQRLVNRRQPLALTSALCRDARALGYESINVDLIYGLPGQTPASMRVLTSAIAGLAPDRLAVYSFARVPWIKPAQRKFRDDQIPAGAAKRELYEIARDGLLAAGYVEIGMDHFARPEDGLARAAAEGALHRNFMGYADARTDVLLGLGVSAISETRACYHQNEKVLPVYDRRIDAGEIPTLRGHRLTAVEQRRREQILSLMTTFRAALDGSDAADARAFLAPLAEDGLVEVLDRELRVTGAGRPFLRNIAAFFDDRYRAERPAAPVYSTSI